MTLKNNAALFLLVFCLLGLQGCSKNEVSKQDLRKLDARVRRLESAISDLQEQVTSLVSSSTETTPAGTPPATRAEAFRITWPGSGQTVSTNPDGVIEVRGVGAIRESRIEVSVRTNTWYAQDYNVDFIIEDNGSWTFSPCYLKGTGYYRTRHTIRARLHTPDGKTYTDLVENVAVR